MTTIQSIRLVAIGSVSLSAFGGIRTHTAQFLKLTTPTSWSTKACCRKRDSNSYRIADFKSAGCTSFPYPFRPIYSRTDSNCQHMVFETIASTNWTTRAFNPTDILQPVGTFLYLTHKATKSIHGNPFGKPHLRLIG